MSGEAEGVFDDGVGPHSPAADDVSLSATDVTSPGVMAAREAIERQGRESEDDAGVARGGTPGHPSDDPAAAEVSDRPDAL